MIKRARVFGTYRVVEQQRLRRACGIAQIRKAFVARTHIVWM